MAIGRAASDQWMRLRGLDLGILKDFCRVKNLRGRKRQPDGLRSGHLFLRMVAGRHWEMEREAFLHPISKMLDVA
ncbi:hypothetical protein TNCV_4747891 [Trichonephila clavipes]|nr:hypothetical protein TNCV_4747891 [Trichonephila clavipes]